MKLAPFDFSNENYNLGHMIVDSLKARPNAVCQIDAATGESETNASVLARSFQLAKCFRKFGVKPGDVLALGGRNHINIHIPYYAALMSGMPIAGVDPLFKQAEIKKLFKICSPRIAFCQKELLDAYLGAKEELGLNTEVICFDEGDHSFTSFIEKYDDKEDQGEFQPVIIDRNKHYVWLVSTGGTTGVVKLAAFTHLAFIKKLELLRNVFGPGSGPVNGENKIGLNISPIQWVSSFFAAASSPMLRQTKLQTSGVQTPDHIIDMIHKYRPTSAFLSPPNATALVKSQRICDFTSFDNIILSGGKIHKDMHLAIRKRVKPGALVVEMYGQTENLGPIFLAGPEGPIGNCGKYTPGLPEYKLVDPETGRDITEPNVTGELWSKGASMTEYYNNPEETALAFTEDGWFKTGDLLYRDEAGYLYFVERLKMLIKYRMYHIIPPDLEAVIRELPGVHDVSVTSIPHEDDLEHPVACVVRSPGSTLTAQEVKEIVANRLSDSQRLRGGVIFMEQLPMTSTGKVARNELRKLVQTLERE